jgi:hypothetical protein
VPARHIPQPEGSKLLLIEATSKDPLASGGVWFAVARGGRPKVRGGEDGNTEIVEEQKSNKVEEHVPELRYQGV